MASPARLELSGKVRGVQVDGREPYAFTYTSGVVAVQTPPAALLFDDAYYPTDETTAVVNPNVLSAGGVQLCSGGIYYKGDAPNWCSNAPIKRVAVCGLRYQWGCGNITLDTHGLFSWAKDGHILVEHSPPSSIGYVLTASVCIVALVVVEAIPTYTEHSWLSREVATVTLAVSVMSGFNWAFVVVTAVATGVAAVCHNSRLVVTCLRAALVVTVAECLTEYNIDATAVGLARVVAATAVLIGAGARGSLWSVPWAIYRGVYPVVVESGTLVDSRVAELWATTVLIATSAFIVGVAVSGTGGWRQSLSTRG